jgi:hypothetical protein
MRVGVPKLRIIVGLSLTEQSAWGAGVVFGRLHELQHFCRRFRSFRLGLFVGGSGWKGS